MTYLCELLIALTNYPKRWSMYAILVVKLAIGAKDIWTTKIAFLAALKSIL
jgi:hypothetical protein